MRDRVLLSVETQACAMRHDQPTYASTGRDANHAGHPSIRRRIFAALRLAHRVLGVNRTDLGLGVGVAGGRVTSVRGSCSGSSRWGFSIAGRLAFVGAAALCAMPAIGQTALGGASVDPNAGPAVGIGGSNPACTTSVGPNAWGAIVVGCATANVTDPTNYVLGSGLSGGVVIGGAASATGANGVAVGQASHTHGDDAVAIGTGAAAGVMGTNFASAIAIGRLASATNTQATALGQNATASGLRAISIGAASTSSGIDTIAYGTSTVANAQNAIGMGFAATATGINSLYLGARTVVGTGSLAESAISIGTDVKATDIDAIAIGRQSASTAANAVSIGRLATAAGVSSFAVGPQSSATGNQGIAIGPFANATGVGAIALGNGAGSQSTAAGANTIALGVGAGQFVKGAQNVGIGGGINGVMKGAGTNVGGTRNIALGSGDGSVSYDGLVQAAAGNNVSGDDNIALGTNAGIGVTASATTSIGLNAGATGTNSIAMGTGAKASGSNSISIGTGNVVTGANSGALGDPSTITGTGSYSLGNNNTISSDNAFVVGSGVTVAAGLNGAVVLGNASTVSGAAATPNAVLGGTTYTFAGGAPAAGDVVSVGSSSAPRQIQNVAAGRLSATSMDAINGSQLYATNLALSSAIANSSVHYFSVNSNGTVGANYNNDGATGQFSLAAGVGSTAPGVQGTAMGYLSTASGTESTAIGYRSVASGVNATAIGNQVDAAADGSIAIGTNNIGQHVDVASTNGIAIGFWTSVSNAPSGVAIGDRASTTAANGVALGASAKASHAGSVALGSGSNTAAAVATPNGTINSTAYTFAGGAPASTVSIGAPGAERTITNVAAGRIAATSTDAINGSQLFASNTAIETVNTRVTNVANSVGGMIGGTTVVNPDGTINGPVYTIQGDNYTNIYDTFVGIDGDLTSINDTLNTIGNGGGIKYFHANSSLADSQAVGANSIAVGPAAVSNAADSIAIGNGAVASNAGAVALGSGSTTAAAVATSGATIAGRGYTFAGAAPASTVSVGSVGAERTITNVAAGRIAADSTDAINGSQLLATNTAVDGVNDRVDNVANSIGGFLGGTTVVNSDGTIIGPTYNIGGNSYTTVSDAFTAVDVDLANLNNSLNNIGNGGGIKYFHANSTLADSQAIGVDSVAVGPRAVANNSNSIAIGNGATSSIDGAIALGSGSVSDRVLAPSFGTIPVGTGAITYNTNDWTLLGAVSVGDSTAQTYRQIINVADGTQAHDAVTLRQLQGAIGSVSATGTRYFHANSTARDSLAGGQEAIAVGPTTVVNGDNGIGIGNGAVVQMTAPGGTAIGQGAQVSQEDAIALGTASSADGIQAIAIGAGAQATYAGSVALGAGAVTGVGSRSGYTAYALAAPQSSAGEVSVGTAGAERQITNVAAGSAPTDAVNVSQLNQVSQNTANALGGGASYDATTGAYTAPTYNVGGQTFNNVGDALNQQNTIVANQGGSIASIIGGGVTYNPATGTVGGMITVGGQTYTNIVDAITQTAGQASNSIQYDNSDRSSLTLGGANGTVIHNVAAGEVSQNSTDAVNGSQLYQTNTTVNNLVDGKIGLVQQQGPSEPITVGASSGGTTVNVSGTDGDRRISGVADGVAPNDVATVNQLNGVTQGLNGQFARLNNKIDGVENRSNAGISAAMAMAALPQAYLPSKSMLSLGGATWNGESGFAMGLSTVSDNGAWVFKVSGATSSRGDYGGAAGVGYQW